MRTQPAALVTLLFLAAPAAQTHAQAQTSAPALLQSALYEQEVKRDLRAAIALYLRIVASHADDRRTAARALVQLGLAYETLGIDSAMQSYRRALADYPEQQEAAERARLRLSSLTRSARAPEVPAEGIVVTQLWTTRASLGINSLSPDGRRVAFIDWATSGLDGVRGYADVALYDLATRRVSMVTDRPSQALTDVYIADAIWSPDGQRLAYTLWDTSWTHMDLYLVGADGRGNTLLVNNEQFAQLKPMQWSATGGFIAASARGWDDRYRIVLISTRDGSSRVVKTLGAHPLHKVSVSPDGRWLLYEYFPAEPGSHDLFLLASDGSSEERLAPHPADEPHGLFTPNGDRVVFLSRRSGQLGLWSIRVEGGRGVGEPELIRPNIGSADLLGFTRTGGLAYRSFRDESEVHQAMLDLGGMGSLTAMEPLTGEFVGRNRRAAWAPDGVGVAFFSQRSDGWHLVVRSAEGAERSHRLPFPVLNRASRPVWTAGGRALLIEGAAVDDPAPSDFKRVTYRVDVESGAIEAQPSLHHAAGAAGGVFRYATERQTRRLAELGLRLYGTSDLQRVRQGDTTVGPGERVLLVREGVHLGSPESGRSLVRGHAHSWELSPDGNTLALALPADTARAMSNVLYVMPVTGGPLRELARIRPDQEFYTVRWLPDGRGLLFAAARADSDRGDFWYVAAEGGSPRRLVLPLDWRQLAELDFAPDGRRVALTTATALNELWLMDGFPWQRRASR